MTSSCKLNEFIKWSFIIIVIFALINFLEKLKATQKIEGEPTSSMCNYSSNIIVTDFDKVFRRPLTIYQTDSRLIKKIRSEFLLPPSKLPYHTKNAATVDTSHFQTAVVMKILQNKTKGFFVEAGAFNGEFLSNSLYLERNFGWEGVLVEPSPEFYMEIRQKNRKAWFVPACLSPHPYPLEMDLKFARYGSAVSDDIGSGDQLVQCFPIFSILLALNRTSIDYFSLDVEGVELAVLNTIPWDKVQISVFSIEYLKLTEIMNEKVQLWMENLGYKRVEGLPKVIHGNVNRDHIYYHPSLVPPSKNIPS